MYNSKLEKLASETNYPCVTISLNTHRTHPDSTQDLINLKNLLKEAKDLVLKDYKHQKVESLLKKIETISKEINFDYNLDSLHIFLSNSTKEIIKSPFSITQNFLSVSESFAIKPLIKTINRTEEYYILLLSNSSVNLYHALNETLIDEITTNDFPVNQNMEGLINNDNSDGKQNNANTQLKYLNQLDKAFLKIHDEKPLNCIVICGNEIYNKLIKVADKSSIYNGHVLLNNNDKSKHKIVSDAWHVIQITQKQNRLNKISEMKKAINEGRVLTDLTEIFIAAKEGRGQLLIINDDYRQQVKMIGNKSFEIVDDSKNTETLDIVSEIAWEIVSKQGEAIFTNQDDLNTFGKIALVTRQ
jgi:dihydrofolate reductase